MPTVAAAILLIAFGIKAAVFPLFFWLPASYHTPPVAVSAVMAGLLTKVGVYAMVRVFSLMFAYELCLCKADSVVRRRRDDGHRRFGGRRAG